MKKILFTIMRFILKVVIFIYYGLLSIRDDLKTKKFSNVILRNEFHGGKVMLLALYEKTSLRDDVIQLLQEAKKNNIFIIAVNTLKLSEESYPQGLIDVYIERDNYGRDFGSYKAGMSYFFENEVHETCDRLLIINDSVFYSRKGLGEFVKSLFNTEVEVLGATENSAHAHHLGSFCISVAGKIAKNKKFKKFWDEYKSSNVRPLVIKRGEFALSKLLKSLASSEKNFKSLFDVSFMEKKLNLDNDFYNSYHFYRREGELAWSNRTITSLITKDEVLTSHYKNYLIDKSNSIRISKDGSRNPVVSKNNQTESKTLDIDYLEITKFLREYHLYDERLHDQFKKRIISFYLDEFTLGSQIHINCLALHHCGLPIIKLDLMFRCVCNMNDIIKLRDQLDESQQEDFMGLMLARLCGDRFLIGLNRIAYQFGIL
ncbi:rhamnan synthesis F family protein [Pantoea endophytica]